MFNEEKVLAGYIEAALWSTPGDNIENLDDKYSRDDLAEETVKSFKQDINKFLKESEKDLIESKLDDDQIGRDFWFTRHGHGVGFWDRGLTKELGESLTKSCKKFKEVHLYVGDDNKIYGQ